MRHHPGRKPFAVANWKMAMTISESLTFVGEFLPAVQNIAEHMTIVLCPPYTALFALSQALSHSPLELGAQSFCAQPGEAHTGEISAGLLADAGCRWVMIGHWEVRRRKGESDADLNGKIHAAFQAGLNPILLVGKKDSERGRAEQALSGRLAALLADCTPEEMARVALIYEPEWTIGAREPASPDDVAAGCSFLRDWISRAFGAAVGQNIRIIYGGSVVPENAQALLSSPDIDGLGAGRKGRDPAAFSQIVRLIAEAKGLRAES